MTRILSKLELSNFKVNGVGQSYKVDDEIFQVTRKEQQLRSHEVMCYVCNEQLLDEEYKNYCHFCGETIHKKCSRKREYFLKPGDRTECIIDLVCLKKFHIRDMITAGFEALQKQERETSKKEEQMRTAEK